MTAAALSLVLPAKGGPKMVQGHSESRLPFILATVSANCLPTYLFTYLPIYHFWLYHSHKLHLTHVAEVDGYCPAWLLIFIIKRLNDGDLQASLKVQMY